MYEGYLSLSIYIYLYTYIHIYIINIFTTCMTTANRSSSDPFKPSGSSRGVERDFAL